MSFDEMHLGATKENRVCRSRAFALCQLFLNTARGRQGDGRMALSARLWGFGSGWLLLVIILAHALNPTASPLTKSSGSAFNPFTAEVALGPEREAPPKKQAIVLRTGAGDDVEAQAGPPLALLAAPATLVPAGTRPGFAFLATPPRMARDAVALANRARAPPLA